MPQNLQQCFEKALRLEASLQLSEGVNMGRRTTVMNIDLEGNEEINPVRDARKYEYPEEGDDNDNYRRPHQDQECLLQMW